MRLHKGRQKGFIGFENKMFPAGKQTQGKGHQVTLALLPLALACTAKTTCVKIATEMRKCSRLR